jgi:hypothetical protein
MTLVWGFKDNELGWYIAEDWDKDDAIYHYGPFEKVEEAYEVINQKHIKIDDEL